MEGRRHCRLSPCPRRPLPPKTIALSRGLRVALGARYPPLDYDAVINGTAERELPWPSFAHPLPGSQLPPIRVPLPHLGSEGGRNREATNRPLEIRGGGCPSEGGVARVAGTARPM